MKYQELPLTESANPFEVDSLRRLTRQVLDRYQRQMEIQQVGLSMDWCQQDFRVPFRPFDVSINWLVQSALAAMPCGGDLSVTMIDGGGQIEIEFADSGMNRSIPNRRMDSPRNDSAKEPLLSSRIGTATLATILQVQREVMTFGGTIETWDQPSGGTARVLVVPVRRSNRFSG